MDPVISSFSNNTFYEGKITDGENVMERAERILELAKGNKKMRKLMDQAKMEGNGDNKSGNNKNCWFRSSKAAKNFNANNDDPDVDFEYLNNFAFEQLSAIVFNSLIDPSILPIELPLDEKITMQMRFSNLIWLDTCSIPMQEDKDMNITSLPIDQKTGKIVLNRDKKSRTKSKMNALEAHIAVKQLEIFRKYQLKKEELEDLSIVSAGGVEFDTNFHKNENSSNGKKTAAKKKRFQDLSFGIVTPYSSQQEVLEEKLVQRLGQKFVHSQCQIATVDGFQGAEVDILIFSAVRSNPNRSIGFLGCDPRINVAQKMRN